MANLVGHLFRPARGPHSFLLAAAIIAGMLFLSAAIGCGTSEPPRGSAEQDTRPSQTSRGIIHSEDVENQLDGESGQGVNPNEPDVRLIDAVDHGDVETLRRLLREGADPNQSDAYGSPPPLWVAVAVESLEMVQILLEAGADPDVPGPDGSSPAMFAAEIQNPEILEVISAAGGTAATAPGDQVETMFNALKQRNPEAIRILLEAGVDPNSQVPATAYVDADADGVRDLWLVPVLYEAVKREQPDTLQLLIDAGADPNATGYVYLLKGDLIPEDNIAAAFGLAENPDIESGPFGDPPLHAAVSAENPEMVEILLNAGANTEAVDRYEETALIEAIRRENVAVVALLIGAGANLEVTDMHRRTPLQMLRHSENDELKGLLTEPP